MKDKFIWFVIIAVIAPVAISSATTGNWQILQYMTAGDHTVIVHPWYPEVFYITWESLFSFDGGQSWAKFPRGVRRASELSPDPSNPAIIYLITWGDIEDTTKKVLRIRLDNSHIEFLGDHATFGGGVPSSVLACPADSRVLFVGTSHGDLYRSDDQGTTWNRIFHTISGEAFSNIYLIVGSTSSSSTIYINNPSNRTELYRTIDGGENWSRLIPNSAQRPIKSLVVSFQDPNKMYLHIAGVLPGLDGLGAAIYRSIDYGDTWVRIFEEVESILLAKGMAIDYTNFDRLVVGHGNGVFLSEDSGQNWQYINLPQSGLRGDYWPFSVAIQTTYPKRILVTTIDALFSHEWPSNTTSIVPSSWSQIKKLMIYEPGLGNRQK